MIHFGTARRFGLAAACALGFLGCPPQALPPQHQQPTGPGYVGTTTCLGCHDGRSASSQHRFLDSAHKAVACETCHGPGYQHVRQGGRLGLFIENPARLSFAQSYKACQDCHGDVAAGFAKTAHAQTQAVSCHACHDVHRPGGLRVELTGTLFSDATAFAELCGTCHGGQAQQFLESKHAQLGVASCVSCHDMHSSPMFVGSPADNSTCLQCHGSSFLGFNTEARIDAHTGPFHPVDPAGTGASRCSACHMPPIELAGQPDTPHDHTMMTFPPALSNEFMDAGMFPPPPNSCAGILGCHDAATPGSGTPYDVTNPEDNTFLQGLYETIGAIP